MEDELIFSKEWFMLEKYHFKILAIITELADNTGTFKGELTIFCENLSIQNSSGNKNKIKSALNYLANNDYITISEDKKIYTIKLSDIAEKTYQYKLKRTWYNQLRTAANKVSWENLLKIFLALLDISRRLRNARTHIITGFFLSQIKITPHRIWYNRVTKKPLTITKPANKKSIEN